MVRLRWLPTNVRRLVYDFTAFEDLKASYSNSEYEKPEWLKEIEEKFGTFGTPTEKVLSTR